MNVCDESKTTLAEDESLESAVLQQLLELHPTRLTLAELVREMGGDSSGGGGGFAERDAVERAVRDLSAVGLLHQGEQFVTPTRAALRFSDLLGR
jgi:predicted transcriptional regulator with HTH domain